MQVFALIQVKARGGIAAMMAQKGAIMPTVDLIILCGIVVAFVAFAVVLAWGDHQTRNMPERR